MENSYIVCWLVAVASMALINVLARLGKFDSLAVPVAVGVIIMATMATALAAETALAMIAAKAAVVACFFCFFAAISFGGFSFTGALFIKRFYSGMCFAFYVSMATSIIAFYR